MPKVIRRLLARLPLMPACAGLFQLVALQPVAAVRLTGRDVRLREVSRAGHLARAGLFSFLYCRLAISNAEFAAAVHAPKGGHMPAGPRVVSLCHRIGKYDPRYTGVAANKACQA